MKSQINMIDKIIPNSCYITHLLLTFDTLLSDFRFLSFYVEPQTEIMRKKVPYSCYSPVQKTWTFWSFPNEMAFFKWSWQRVKVLPRPWASKSKLSMIRPLKWGTLRLWTPNGFKMASRQSWKIKENVCFTSKTDVFSFFQLWRLAILKPVGVHRHNVPHFKGLIMLYLDSSNSNAWQHFYLLPRPFAKGHFTP